MKGFPEPFHECILDDFDTKPLARFITSFSFL
jgi:hypothetical protein